MDTNDDMFGGMSPEEIKALLATVGDPAQLDALKGQGDIADKLRYGNRPDESRMAGNVYIPDIAGSLLGGVDAYRGKKLGAETDKARQGIYANQATQSQAFIDAMRRRMPGMGGVSGGGGSGYGAM